MRSILVGAVDSTATALRALAASGVAPEVVATLPPSHASRHSDYCDIAPIAAECGSRVEHVTKTDDAAFVEMMTALRPDYLFVIGWSRIVGLDVLRIPKHGSIAFHPSALPENRGRAVIPWTILQRKTSTGASLFWMDEGIDSGDLLAQRRFDVANDETATTLYAKHLDALDGMLREVVPALARFEKPRTPQDHAKATWCGRRTADDGLIDWNASAEDVWTLIRATTRPYPGAFTVQGDRRVILWDAEYLPDAPYSGTPGQVQEIDAHGVIITCGDGKHIAVRSSEPNEFRRHERLGIHPLSLWEKS